MRSAVRSTLKSKNRHWAAINELGFVAGMRLLFWISKVGGRWPFRVILYPVLLWYLLAKPLPRRASRNYLKRVRMFVAAPGGIVGVLRHFAAFAETLLDKMLLWSGRFNATTVRYQGVAEMDSLLREKRGALLICSHLGNLELCRVLSRRRSDLRLTMLVHTRHAEAFNQMLAALDPESALNLLQVTDMTPATAILLAEKIAQGEFVVIAGDRVPVAPNPRVAMADFLGAPAPFPVGPYILASVLQCPVYLLFSLRRDGHSEVHFELLRESVQVPRKGRQEVLTALVAAYAARLEHHCLRAPLQWFNFYDFWHDTELESRDASR